LLTKNNCQRVQGECQKCGFAQYLLGVVNGHTKIVSAICLISNIEARGSLAGLQRQQSVAGAVKGTGFSVGFNRWFVTRPTSDK
jgi:hypothetical protein